MENVINLNLLAKMPMTDEFAKLLFGNRIKPKDVDVTYIPKNIPIQMHDLVCFRCNKQHTMVYIQDDGTIEYSMTSEPMEIANCFQIVRYIDNYLQNKSSGEMIRYLASNSPINVQSLRDGIESVVFIYMVSEDKFIPVNKKDMDKKITDFIFLVRDTKDNYLNSLK